MKYTGLVLFLLFITLSARAQYLLRNTPLAISGKSMVELKREALKPVGFQSDPALTRTAIALNTLSQNLNQNQPLASFFSTTTETPSIYSYHDLGIFCKLEVQLERAAKIPIKIRLGDVPYVDYLEGKRDSPVY